jgi:hypothetical protein
MAGPLRTIVYSRVSTDAQERDGTSLDTQDRASPATVGRHSASAHGGGAPGTAWGWGTFRAVGP